MKYIVVNSGGILLPVPFCDLLSHADMAKAYPQGHDRRHSPGQVVSAGFVDLTTYETSGHSASLDLGPGPNDSLLLKALFLGGDGLLLAINASLKDEQGMTANGTPTPAESSVNEDNQNSDSQSASDPLGRSDEAQLQRQTNQRWGEAPAEPEPACAASTGGGQ